MWPNAFNRPGLASGPARPTAAAWPGRWVRAVLVLLALAVPALGQPSTPVQLTSPGGEGGDAFGQAVAIDGDTLIVGAPGSDVGANTDQGSASIYRWTGTGWTLEATLTASDGTASDHFGFSVALSGDTAVVGADGDDVGGNVDQGSAYVFVRFGTVWTQQAKLTAADGVANDLFGASVALSGDTAVVGADGDDVGGNVDQGSAYVFVRSGTVWTQQAKLTASDGDALDFFGLSVALSGDTALVGAMLSDEGDNLDQGSAYVFVRSGTTWTQQAKLTALDGGVFDRFGNSVALSGDTAVVGAYFNVGQGSAYVFVRSGTVWTQQAKLTASDGDAVDFFGFSVALSGDTAVVAAHFDDVGANSNQGSASVFVRSGTTWTQQARLTAPDGATDDNFGYWVALSGDTALVGANGDDVGANADQGSAWVFSSVGSTWIGPGLRSIASDGSIGDAFGFSVAVSGDTAVVGAFADDLGAASDQGSAYVFVRSSTTWTQQAKLVASDGVANDYFGCSVAVSGDTAVVGANLNDPGANPNQGSAYVFVRSGTTWTQQAKLVASDGSIGDNFGNSIAVWGDTAVVGAFADDGANPEQGSVYVFVRSGTTWAEQAKLVAADGAAFDMFGVSVAASGDTVVVGAHAADEGANPDQGSAYVFVRSGTTWTQQAKLTAADGAGGDNFGISVALAGDTAVVGARRADEGANPDQGSAYVFVRSGTTWTQQAKLTASDGSAYDDFGYSVAVWGDTTVVGAYFDTLGTNLNQGSAYVFTRSGTTWTQQAQLTAAEGAAGDFFGFSVAVSGDAAVVGASHEDVGASTDQGSVHTFDLMAGDFSVVRNDSTQTTFSSLAAAILPAQSGQQLTASEAAWRNIDSLDTAGRSLILRSSGNLRTPPGSVLTLANGSSLRAAAGSAMDVFGDLRAGSGASVDAYSAAFSLGSRGTLTARTGSSLTVNSPAAWLGGQTRLEQNAALTFSGSATTIGPVTAFSNAGLSAGGTFTNIDTFTITSGAVSAPLFWNRAQANVFGSSAVFGSFTNEAGATTTIRSGSLYVFGSLTNNGTVVGTICSSCLGTPPNLDVGGTLALGSGANLALPFTGSLVHVGGSFDCAINSNTRFDLSLATLQLEGSGAEQTLEVMSRDIGPSATGLDRTIPGNFPIGVLEIGPAPATVRLVDARNNDGPGQAACEALYVGTLRVHAGSRLINPSCKVYYSTLVNNGTVDVPANLVRIPPPCSADFNHDGLVTPADVAAFVSTWFASLQGGTLEGDFDGNGLVTPADVGAFVSAWFTALSSGSC